MRKLFILTFVIFSTFATTVFAQSIDESVEVLKQKCNDKVNGACSMLALKLHESGQKKEGEKYAKQACDQSHDCNSLIWIYEGQGKLDEARAFLKKDCDNLDSDDGCYRLSFFEKRNGNNVDSEKYLKMACARRYASSQCSKAGIVDESANGKVMKAVEKALACRGDACSDNDNMKMMAAQGYGVLQDLKVGCDKNRGDDCLALATSIEGYEQRTKQAAGQDKADYENFSKHIKKLGDYKVFYKKACKLKNQTGCDKVKELKIK